MSKPDDIPQDVWDAAITAVGDFDVFLEGRAYAGIVLSIARAILAERERCAALADAFELEDPLQETEFVNKHLGFNWDAGFDAGCTLIARAIRKGD